MMSFTFSVFVCLFAYGLADNPGIEVRVNSKGLETIKEIALSYLHIKNFKVKELKGKNYELYDLKTTYLNLGQTSILLAPPNLITAKVDDASLNVKGKWKFSYSFVGTFSGDAAVSFIGLDLCQVLDVGMEESGKPTFSVGKCKATIADLDITITDAGWLTWILNTAFKLIKDYIKTKVQSRLCNGIDLQLKRLFKEFRSNITMNAPFVLGTKINLGLTKPPVVTSNSITVDAKGRCFSSTNNPYQVFPFTSPFVPPLPITNQMGEILISQYVMNTLLYSLWQEGYFTQNFTQEQVSDVIGVSVTADSLAQNISLFEPFRGRPLEFVVSGRKAPRGTFNQSGLTLKGFFSLTINAQPVSNKPTKIVTIKFNATISGKVVIRNDVVTGEITHLNVRAITSEGEMILQKYFDTLVKGVIEEHILPAVNGAAASGFQIPAYIGYRLIKPTLLFEKNALLFETSIGKAKNASVVQSSFLP